DPSLSVFSPFTCGIKDLKDDSFQTILKHLIAELNARLKSIPISRNEISKSQYVSKTAGMTEVKDEDFFKSIAQNAVQLKLVLSNCKRKVSEMEEDSVFVDKDENMENMVRKVLRYITWLLEKMQKPDSDFRSEER
ncbi:17383_t:CDS:2, partial [Funneliformis geosporum]